MWSDVELTNYSPKKKKPLLKFLTWFKKIILLYNMFWLKFYIKFLNKKCKLKYLHSSYACFIQILLVRTKFG